MLYHVLSIFTSVDEIIIKVLRSIPLISCGAVYRLVYKEWFLLRLSLNTGLDTTLRCSISFEKNKEKPLGSESNPVDESLRCQYLNESC